MLPTVSFVGKSNSGKTSVLERLIGELKRRGYRIAAVKHDAHGFELDQRGKDSWRLAQAGSDVVILSSPQRLALIKQVEHDLAPTELYPFIGEDIDLVLTEGYKKGATSKIEVHRKDLGGLLCSPQELVAIVTDEPLDLPLPQYAPDDAEGLADFLEKKLLSSEQQEETILWVNGTSVPLNPFVQNFFGKVILGMLSTLKGVAEVKNLQLWLRKG